MDRAQMITDYVLSEWMKENNHELVGLDVLGQQYSFLFFDFRTVIFKIWFFFKKKGSL